MIFFGISSDELGAFSQGAGPPPPDIFVISGDVAGKVRIASLVPILFIGSVAGRARVFSVLSTLEYQSGYAIGKGLVSSTVKVAHMAGAEVEEVVRFHDLLLYRSSTVNLEFQVRDEEDTPFDITNWHVRFLSDNVTKTSEDPLQIVITDAFQGYGTVFLAPSDMIKLYEGILYRLEIYNDEGEVYPFVIGKINFIGAPW